MGSKPSTPKGKKVSFKGKVTEVAWEFDAKDTNWKKYGNFSTSTILKLVSKFKKQKGKEEEHKNVDVKQVAEVMSETLNFKLKSMESQETYRGDYQLVAEEIEKFEAANGFINVYLVNEQFMDRVQVQIKKKNVTYNEGFLGGAPSLGNLQSQDSAFVIKPIGFLESCFREKFGTPRQSGFVKNARARLTLVNEINSSCLEGLSDFGYIWVIFIFHVGLNDYNNKKTKIAPPKLEGTKKGVFATRSPHRYNPIGLSIAKLNKIEDRTVYMSGIDLIHGTPVLDIKPYHYLDSLEKDELKFPQWLIESKEKGRLKVEFTEEALEELKILVHQKRLDFYDKLDEIQELIQQIFELNPHSVHTLNKHKEGIYAVALDNLNIVYKMNEEKTDIQIVKILWCDNTSPKEKLRTKEWLVKISELMDSSMPNEKEEEEEKDQKKNE